MSQIRDLLVSAADDLFSQSVSKESVDAAAAGEWPADLWRAVRNQGLHDALVPEDLGGTGLGFGDAVAVLRVAGRHAAPVPLAESLMGTRLLAEAGLPVPDGTVTMAQSDEDEELTLHGEGSARTVTGTLRGVPWARVADRVVTPVELDGGFRLLSLDLSSARIAPAANTAGDYRDTVRVDAMAVDPADLSAVDRRFDRRRFRELGALSRVALASGALDRILELSLDYARERVQFGRPISQFQAVQQSLASMAGEVAAAIAAADAAGQALDEGAGSLAVAAAKVRVGESSGEAARIAHQVHGAIGFTHEHELHHKTRRLWAWRDEFGTEGEWAEVLGSVVLGRGGGQLWRTLTTSA